jgi:hypothetical protein
MRATDDMLTIVHNVYLLIWRTWVRWGGCLPRILLDVGTAISLKHFSRVFEEF